MTTNNRQRCRRLSPRLPALLAALALIAAAGPTACGRKQSPPAPPRPEVPVAGVVQRDVPVYLEMVGQTRGSQDVEVTARIEGWVQGIHFREGTEVAKGTLLYTIDPRPLQEQVAAAEGSLAAARAQVAAARSQVAEARAQVGAAGAKLAQAEGDVAKFKPLEEKKAVSRRDLDNAVANRDAAKGQVLAAEERVKAAEGMVEAAQGQVDAAAAQVEFAKIKLGYAKVSAPISGLIGKTKAQIGDLVGKPPIVVLDTISTIDPILVDFSVNEREYLAARRTAGQNPIGVTSISLELLLADGSTYPHRGTIDFAERQVDPTTGSLQIQASFPNPEKLLRPGQFTRVRGVVETKTGALLVPQKAVQELQGQNQVLVVGAEDKVEVRNVKMGPRVGDLWVASEGLSAGERVVVDGFHKLRPGMQVAPMTVPQPEAPASPAAPAGPTR